MLWTDSNRSKRVLILIFTTGILCLGSALISTKVMMTWRVRPNIRDAKDILKLLDSSREAALHSEPSEAVVFLYKWQSPITDNWPNVDASIVELERNRAIKDVIHYLRIKTGKDLGNDPIAWILAFGDENLKANQKTIPQQREWIRDILNHKESM